MLVYITLIFLCQLVGEGLVLFTGLPVPGPVVGMILLFCGLMIKGNLPSQLGAVADTLISNLSLMFVPAGVGVVIHAGLIGTDLLPITVSLVVSTALTVAVTGLLMTALDRSKSSTDPEGEGS